MAPPFPKACGDHGTSACDRAGIEVVPGQVRALLSGGPDPLLGYAARVRPVGNESVVKPGVVVAFRDTAPGARHALVPTNHTSGKVREGVREAFELVAPHLDASLTELACEGSACTVHAGCAILGTRRGIQL